MRIIAGKYGGRTLKTVEGKGYRPAMSKVREALFSMLGSYDFMWQGSICMDLFAGSGSLGFEALSRGAKHVTFVELDKEACAMMRKNRDTLGIPEHQVRIAQDTCEAFLRVRGSNACNLICIDPPYAMNVVQKHIDTIIRNGWLKPEGIIVAEVSSKASFDAEASSNVLDILFDRAYGQTRIIGWIVKKIEQ